MEILSFQFLTISFFLVVSTKKNPWTSVMKTFSRFYGCLTQFFSGTKSNDNPIKKFDTIVRIIPLVGSLAKAQFCNVLEHPISKFERISRNISHYYSSSSRKKSLYQIKYILRLFCARTLARKHKSTVRAFLKRLVSEFLEEFFIEEERVLSLILPRDSSISRGLYRGPFWYFDIICIYDVTNDE
ncbi:hypothetical protein Cgig2_016761 [Carnegiea gigantea]|uniref:Domain X domain-containing protein n=1 Tax=Carnegiea gigantea TaxID=171969 RepID=A0A9Q1GKW6_9CARY|nr:hypothetical protein Cgig2_016761 [Carnegiea gigantea]